MKQQLTKQQLKKIQNLELNVLKKFDSLCNNYNIPYTLAGGTLIGAIRHKGFIPWDDDIDVYVLRNDFEKIRKNFPKELKNTDYFYQTNQTDQDYFYPFDKIRINGTIFEETFLSNHNIHQGVYIDIFPIDIIPDNKVLSTFQYLKYRVLRLALMSKYINISARNGKKKLFAYLINFLFKEISLKSLYSMSEKVAKKYDFDNNNYRRIRNLNSIGSDGIKETYNIKCIQHLKKVQFENCNFYISKYYDYMLRKIYGDYMKLPPASHRVTRHELEKLKL